MMRELRGVVKVGLLLLVGLRMREGLILSGGEHVLRGTGYEDVLSVLGRLAQKIGSSVRTLSQYILIIYNSLPLAQGIPVATEDSISIELALKNPPKSAPNVSALPRGVILSGLIPLHFLHSFRCKPAFDGLLEAAHGLHVSEDSDLDDGEVHVSVFFQPSDAFEGVWSVLLGPGSQVFLGEGVDGLLRANRSSHFGLLPRERSGHIAVLPLTGIDSEDASTECSIP